MTRRDLVWLLGLPLYVVLGTFRHEAAHAAVAIAQGATITNFVILPTVTDEQFYWGYVTWQGGSVTWLATAAPYLLNAVTTLLGGILAVGIPMARWIWINVVIVLVASPLVDSTYQYARTMAVGGGDVAVLLGELPAELVHGWFLVAIPVYAVVLVTVSRHGPRGHSERTAAAVTHL